MKNPIPLKPLQHNYLKLKENEWTEFEKLHTQSINSLSFLKDLREELEITFSISIKRYIDMIKSCDKKEKVIETEDEGDFYVAVDLILTNSAILNEDLVKENVVTDLKQSIKVMRYILKELYKSSRWRRRAVILELLFRSNIMMVNTLLEINAKHKADEFKKEQMLDIQQNLIKENNELNVRIEAIKINHTKRIVTLQEIINSLRHERVSL